MKKEELIEKGNKIIAEFDGYIFYHPGIDFTNIENGDVMFRKEIFSKIPIDSNDDSEKDEYYFDNMWGWKNEDEYIYDLKYHLSYDLLIPICKKIYKLGYDININSGFRRINISRNDFGLSIGRKNYDEELRGNKSLYHDYTDVECLFVVLVDFIEWFKDNNHNGYPQEKS